MRGQVDRQSSLFVAFSMNRPRFELHDLVGKFFSHVVAEGLAEQVIGWMKHIGGMSRTRFIGLVRIEDDAKMTASEWNLLRMTRSAGMT